MNEPGGQASVNPIHVFIPVLEDSCTATLERTDTGHGSLDGLIHYFVIMPEDSCTAALEIAACECGFLGGFNHRFIAMRKDSCNTALEKVPVEYGSGDEYLRIWLFSLTIMISQLTTF